MKKLVLICIFSAISGLANAQDQIMLRSKEAISCKVLRVNLSDIEYQRGDNPEGPIYTLPTSDILFIQYANGSKDTFEDARPIPQVVTGLGPAWRLDDLPPVRNYAPRYQGEISIAYGLGVGAVSRLINTNRIAVETVHGARINAFNFTGIGVGYTYLYDVDILQGIGIVPVFVNSKGYYPFSKKVSVYLSLDVGMAIAVSGPLEGEELYTAVGPGFTFRGQSGKVCDLGVRFQHMGEGLNAFLFRIGVGF